MRVVVGIEKIAEVRAEVVMAIVVIPFYGRVFNRAVHALGLSVRPSSIWIKPDAPKIYYTKLLTQTKLD